jgi:hypothetical protein
MLRLRAERGKVKGGHLHYDSGYVQLYRYTGGIRGGYRTRDKQLKREQGGSETGTLITRQQLERQYTDMSDHIQVSKASHRR